MGKYIVRLLAIVVLVLFTGYICTACGKPITKSGIIVQALYSGNEFEMPIKSKQDARMQYYRHEGQFFKTTKSYEEVAEITQGRVHTLQGDFQELWEKAALITFYNTNGTKDFYWLTAFEPEDQHHSYFLSPLSLEIQFTDDRGSLNCWLRYT